MRSFSRYFSVPFGVCRTCALLLLLGILVSGLRAEDSRADADTSELARAGYAHRQAGEPQRALEAFNQAIAADGNDLAARIGQAIIYADQQQHANAFASYDAIIQGHPTHAFAWNGRGLAAFNLEDFDEALHSFLMAIADQPVNGFFYESLAWTQLCRAEFSAAAESAKTAALMYNRSGETSVYPLLIAYFAYHESGDALNALRALEYANKNKPLNQWPSPVIDYLSEQISATQLISHVTNTAEETEAHTYIGLYLRLLGETRSANRHLQWVSRHGNPHVFEYTLARALNLQNSVATVAH